MVTGGRDRFVLGRMAARVAAMLRGKHKPTFTPNVDTGDHVIIINADKVRVTANKLLTKIRYHHSNYPGGLKAYPLGRQMEKIRPRQCVASSKACCRIPCSGAI